jgi:hypothetical protein
MDMREYVNHTLGKPMPDDDFQGGIEAYRAVAPPTDDRIRGGIKIDKETEKDFITLMIKRNSFKQAPGKYETMSSDFSAKKVKFPFSRSPRTTMTAEVMQT